MPNATTINLVAFGICAILCPVKRSAARGWEPSGLVKILDLEPPNSVYDECAFVEFVEDHPMGYKAGTVGRYQLKELRKPEPVKL